MLETNWYGFLDSPRGKNALSTTSNPYWIMDAYLTNCQMTEPTNEFCFIQSVGSHFHSTHGLHLLVHREQSIFGDFHFEFRCFAEMRTEGIFMKRDSKWPSRVCICWRLNTANLWDTGSKWLKERVGLLAFRFLFAAGKWKVMVGFKDTYYPFRQSNPCQRSHESV